LGYALDSADGQLARLRRSPSRAGEWLDHTIDAAKITALHLAIAISIFRFADVADEWVLVPLGFTLVANVMFFSWVLRDLFLAGTSEASSGRQEGERPAAWKSFARAPEDYGVLMLSLLLLPAASAFLAVYGLLFAWNFLFSLVSLPRRYSAIRAGTGSSSLAGS